ncbi:hypothetical protein Nepgr_031785 [Nepenthes gracilis]|uniref:Uncharacterized protein n=1 Tax=Nepenthes gracilis TaxID=150966 RepID=A0AAD3TJG8_NEPGR|nr:hypothetical protein Nepgr_031785 [Nepenthes gracilis]
MIHVPIAKVDNFVFASGSRPRLLCCRELLLVPSGRPTSYHVDDPRSHSVPGGSALPSPAVPEAVPGLCRKRLRCLLR